MLCSLPKPFLDIMGIYLWPLLLVKHQKEMRAEWAPQIPVLYAKWSACVCVCVPMCVCVHARMHACTCSFVHVLNSLRHYETNKKNYNYFRWKVFFISKASRNLEVN